MLPPPFQRFAEKSPVTVMAGGLIERLLCPARLDDLFEATATEQYTRDLLFSTVFDLMSQVVLGSQPSLHAAYQASLEEISVSVTSLYNKVNGLETAVSEALVRYSAEAARALIEQIDGARPPLLPGFTLRIVDGNVIAASEHRLPELRTLAAGALPGKSLVILDPALGLMQEVFCLEDGHAQERSIFDRVLSAVEANQLWLADRAFSTSGFLRGLAERGAYFAIRRHGKLRFEELDALHFVGERPSGQVYEQAIRLPADEAAGVPPLILRRVRVVLKQATRSGETEVDVLTNLPASVADALTISALYLGRWKIEHAFEELALHLESEIHTLGYPRAALFGFCVAVVSYNVLAVLKAALRSEHGQEAEAELSGYYLANELASTYRGMLIAIAEEEWQLFSRSTVAEVALLLRALAAKVKLSAFRRHPRGKKKPPPKRTYDPNHPHVSNAKLIAARK